MNDEQIILAMIRACFQRATIRKGMAAAFRVAERALRERYAPAGSVDVAITGPGFTASGEDEQS